MDLWIEEAEILRELRAKSASGTGVCRAERGELGVFEPEAAQRINALNYADMTLPDRLVDLLRRRKSVAVNWKEVRAAWIGPLRRLAEPEPQAALAERMDRALDARLGRPVDFVWAIQEIATRSLLPVVIAGLSPRDVERVEQDQTYKLTRLLSVEPQPETFAKTLRAYSVQIRAGLVVRRELRGRAKRKRARRLDMTDPIVDLLPSLGMDRAVDAVTTVLTAIAGPPGAAAVCLAFELVRRPEWAERLAKELAAVPGGQLYAAPTRSAPETYRFVKEILRMWSPPLLLTRSARCPIHLGTEKVEPGERFFVSTYMTHHDPRLWRDPDRFDPDRWLPGAPNGPSAGSHYVPFGWAPTSCIGAALGTAQLIFLCDLLCRKYRLEVDDPGAMSMALSAVPLPQKFQGTIRRR